MISVENVEVRFGQSTILEDVNIEVREGEFLGLIGPNGSGKTTTLRTINGLVTPRSGRVLVDGANVADLSARELGRRVATVPQDTNLSFDFTVRQVVELGRHAHRPRFGGVDPNPEAIDRALQRMAIEDLAERPITEVSGGERQRVLLARALAQSAPVLLLDEPTASLDIHHQVRMLGHVRQLVDSDERTVIAAIHDLDLAARFCDELILLANKQVRTAGPPSQVLSKEHLEAAFGGQIVIGTDPATGAPTVTALEDDLPIAQTDVSLQLN